VKSEQEAGAKVIRLVEKGVDIPNPYSVYIGDDVDIGLISGDRVKIHPGCRIHGAETVISAGCELGREGPVTIEGCQLAHSVELKAGYFKNSVFLDQANMASGAHVRDGCIIEEQAGGAHCVGLKQTILLPFVTLGSLINFCDCLMAGGTSRKNHSEVGSSFIHFNFTPDGDKTTPSLIGDVPRGVMLNQPPIFLGGQGGIVGPVRLGFGNVVAAGTILRNDVLENNKLIVGKTHRARILDVAPKSYSGLRRIVENNVIYIANLLALEQWYVHVRHPFLSRQAFGEQIYRGLLSKLQMAKRERLKRLKAMAEKAADSPAAEKAELWRKIEEFTAVFTVEAASSAAVATRDRFLEAFRTHAAEGHENYIECVQSLPVSLSLEGTSWLDGVVKAIGIRVQDVLPSMRLFTNILENRKEEH
jgi:bifunctional UDP-N-acetylglucosamine pyrophosphorylase / glucosamine-1-phosphate N-acetyltransferase